MPTMTQQEQQRVEDDASLADRIRYVGYSSEKQLGAIMALVDRDLSEPYSIFTYRYFLSGWPDLCILAYIDDDDENPAAGAADDNKSKAGEGEDWHGTLVGVIVGKADNEGSTDPKSLCGYIAMLAVETSYRRAGIGRKLVSRAVDRMVEIGCQEVALEAEVTNTGALNLYERQGFAREERLFKYYLNGVDAFRLKLWLAGGEEERKGEGEGEGGHNRIHQHSHGELEEGGEKEEGGDCCCSGDHHHHDHHPDEEEEEEHVHGHSHGGHEHTHNEEGGCCGGHDDEDEHIATEQSLALLSLEGRMVGAARAAKAAANGAAAGGEGEMR